MTSPPDVLAGKHILLGVSGSIAAFKAVALASELTKIGALVDVLLTSSATRFVTPLSFSAITHRSVSGDVFSASEHPINHVALGQGADIYIVAPATADCIAGLAMGLGDDPVRLVALSTRAPLVLAPAMETAMYENPATQENLATLRRRGATIVEPEVGRLASGGSGQGRLAEPAEIINVARAVLDGRHDLEGRRIVVTAGGTREPIDPVRFIGNRSTGKMGFAVAEAARARGAVVVLIVGSVTETPPSNVEIHEVGSASELGQALRDALEDADAVIMAAAVADYRVDHVVDHKMKRTDDGLVLRLVPNPDIIAGIKGDHLVKVGFAAETHDLLANAQAKLLGKGLDLIVANDVASPGSGFGTDTNLVTLIDAQGQESLPM
ncbi:MAG TPA: bifunctional phosphopantothenoylcysteine decarboxylase/phosphopantothenate--cysteine ligase CoaBC, partial [Chloroflexota bacterium]|nr:bifunctional phosphopantothenoylcysteine decarboxylase/phosphopantothenate--cysteine ligase CoaBC [Chloroflexota bacterium]